MLRKNMKLENSNGLIELMIMKLKEKKKNNSIITSLFC